MTGVGIALTVLSALGVLVVAAAFLWAAREDGRQQARVDGQLGPDGRREAGTAARRRSGAASPRR